MIVNARRTLNGLYNARERFVDFINHSLARCVELLREFPDTAFETLNETRCLVNGATVGDQSLVSRCDCGSLTGYGLAELFEIRNYAMQVDFCV